MCSFVVIKASKNGPFGKVNFFRRVQHLIHNIKSVNARPERLDVPGTRSCELKNSRFISISNFENSWTQFLFLFGYFIRYDVVIISVVTSLSSCNYTIFLANELIRVDWPTYPLCLAHLPIVSTCWNSNNSTNWSLWLLINVVLALRVELVQHL